MATWPRRRGSRRNSGELACVAVAYQALSAGTGGGSALLGWWWSYGSGAGVARRELCAAMATAELWELGGCCWRCKTAKETEAKQMGARLSAGGRWREEGTPRRVVACVDRPAATHGRCPRHAACEACRCRPLNGARFSSSEHRWPPDSEFSR